MKILDKLLEESERILREEYTGMVGGVRISEHVLWTLNIKF